MAQASLVKVVAAFVAGLVIALGSALIYVRVSELMGPEPGLGARVALPQTAPAQLPDTGQNPSAQPAAPPSAPTVHTSLIRRASRNTAPRHRIAEVHRQPAKRVEIAQNTPPRVVPDPPAVSVAQAQEPTAPAIDAVLQDAPASEPAPARQPHVITLQSGTNLVVRLGETLSTDHNYTGDTFRATLESPIVMDGFIIADKGSKVLGRIVSAQKAGRVQGVSDLLLSLTEINTTDGQRVRIESTTYDKRGPASPGEDTAKIAGGAALGAIIG